jgi:protein phosphatase
VASRFAVDVLSHDLAQLTTPLSDQEIEQRVRSALDRAHCLIADLSQGDPECRGAETTVVLALLRNHRLYVTGVGDSRAYLVRGKSIERLTVDDTIPDALLHIGQISADEAKRHFMRNKLLSVLGMKEFKASNEIRVLDAYHGDRFLLASDGLTDVVDERQLRKTVSENDDPQEAADALLRQALDNGSGDDVTCVVFHVQSMLENGAARVRPPFWQRLKSWIGLS